MSGRIQPHDGIIKLTDWFRQHDQQGKWILIWLGLQDSALRNLVIEGFAKIL